MADMITRRADGMDEHAYVGKVGWTGKGQQLRPDATIEEWLEGAGMDWKILRGIVRYATARDQDSSDWGQMDDKHVLFRSDTKAALGCVSDTYKVVQPRAVLEFFRDLARDNGFMLETAGTLFGGTRFWALAKIGADSYVRDVNDKIKAYLLLVTSADGTLATEGKFICKRVVCANTLAMGLRETGATSIKVSHRSVFNERDMKQKLGVAGESSFDATMNELRTLANSNVSKLDMVRDTVNLFYPGTFDPTTGESLVTPAQLDKMTRSGPVTRVSEMALDGRDLMGAGMAGVAGTAYGWLNSVTQYVDHEARAHSADNRTNSAWFGKGSDLKTKAYEVALTHANGTQVQYAPEPAPVAPQDDHAVSGAALLDSLLS